VDVSAHPAVAMMPRLGELADALCLAEFIV
jgi:hypothetical protein